MRNDLMFQNLILLLGKTKEKLITQYSNFLCINRFLHSKYMYIKVTQIWPSFFNF